MNYDAKAPLGAWYGLGAMILASMTGSAIVALMPLLAEAMKHELLLTDAQIGALRGIATLLVSAVASYPIGWLADRIDRRIIFAACALIWSAATAASGLAHSYSSLFICAMGIAVGEAVLGPVVFALIADLFPSRARLLANSIFFVSQLLGFAAGLAIAGTIIGVLDTHRSSLPGFLANLSTWRLALMAHALPVILLVPMLLLIPLPKTGTAPASQSVPSHSVTPYLRQHAGTLFPVFFGFGAIGAANWTVFGWIAVEIERMFKVPASNVGIALGQVFGLASLVGVTLANCAARRFAQRWGPKAPVRIAEYGAVLAATSSCLYLFAASPAQFYAVALLQLAASMGGLTLSPTVIQLLAPASLRARVFAVAGLFYTVFTALSPLAVGAISDLLGPDPHHLVVAMLIIGVPLYALGVGLIHIAAHRLGPTLEAVRLAEHDAVLQPV